MTKLFVVVMLSLAPVMAQMGGQDIPIPTWHAPAFWDGASVTSDSTRGLRANAAASGTPVTGASALVGIVPCRLVDTRDNTLPTPFGFPSITGGTVRTVTVRTSTRCNIPAAATAYSLNFTVVPLQASLGYLSAWPTPDRPVPEVSILNSPAGQIIANAAVIPAGTNGAFDVFVTHTAEVIIDINGYYAPQINLVAGSAAAPTLTFGSDPGTGLYSSGAGTVSVTTGGQNRLTVRADGDLELPGSIRKGGNLFLHNLGINSTATGVNALGMNIGFHNTANGYEALYSNVSGSWNTAFGSYALHQNTGGGFNIAVGAGALYGNTRGFYNTAIGVDALYSNTTGLSNTADGGGALRDNTIGSNNTANGVNALYLNTTGNDNIALGYFAGSNHISGSNNIYIGNSGAEGESDTIRIGRGDAATRIFLDGIWGRTTGVSGAVAVVVDSNGQLGTISSSRRYKEDIRDMGESSTGLMYLRPVIFRYKKPYADGSKPLEYGLIAEEVAAVYPDLVVRGPDGQVETVQYQKLTPMLLNEIQKQQALIRALEARLAALEARGDRTAER